MDSTAPKTEQETFWEGEFGEDYIGRNEGADIVAANVNLFAQALRRADPIASCTEIGTNVGLNLQALRIMYPGIACRGVEINRKAAEQARRVAEDIHVGPISSWEPTASTDLAFSKTVLIHINPEDLQSVYNKLYRASTKYVLLAEYYNTTPVEITYRGHSDRLFKRDFAGEMLDRFADLQLLDYGFVYNRDRAFPLDDVSWFLMRKRSA